MKALAATCFALAALLLSGCSKRADESPQAAAQRFYEFYLSERINNGLPSIEQCRQMAPILSRGLQDAIGKARREQDRFVTENPGEKPPWIEGDLFTSLFEGATSYALGTVDLRAKRADVMVMLKHRDSRGHEVEWTDRLVLVQENDHWVVENVEYGGNWDFANHGDLKKTLGPLRAEPEAPVEKPVPPSPPPALEN